MRPPSVQFKVDYIDEEDSSDSDLLYSTTRSSKTKPYACVYALLFCGLSIASILAFAYLTTFEGTTAINSIFEKKLNASRPLKRFVSDNISWVVKYPFSNVAILSINAYGVKTKHIQNHIEYAKLHGYNYFEVIELYNLNPSRRPTWHKLPAIKEIFDFGIDYVMAIDADAFFANCTIELQKITDQMALEDKSWCFAGDRNAIINAGVFIFRNTNAGRMILRYAWDVYRPKIPQDPTNGDNGAFQRVLMGQKNFTDVRADVSSGNHGFGKTLTHHRSKVKHFIQAGNYTALKHVSDDILPHVMYMPQRRINSFRRNYQPGDFIIHFPGKGPKKNVTAEWLHWQSEYGAGRKCNEVTWKSYETFASQHHLL